MRGTTLPKNRVSTLEHINWVQSVCNLLGQNLLFGNILQ